VAGPGGQEIGRLSVRVVPDSDLVRPLLLRDLEQIERSVELHIRAVFTGSGLAAEARRLAETAERAATVAVPVDLDADQVDAEFARIVARLTAEPVTVRAQVDDSALEQALRQLAVRGRQFTQLASITVAIGGLAAATSGLAGLAVGAAQATGALLLLPAAGFAATAAITALVVGMQGFGDALSSMDDPAAFAEALANLAPSAAATATAIRDLRPAFTGLRLDVQERLFAGLADTITGLAGSYLPVLRTGLGGIATELNTGARSFASFLTSSQSVADTSSIFADIRAAIAALAPAGNAFAAALRDITTVGASFLPGLAGDLADAAERFAAFIAQARATGQLADWIQTGITAVDQLVAILGNLGSIAASVFGALDSSGGGFLAFLADATGRLADFLDSAEGAEILGAVAQFAATAGRAISTVLGTALEELGPVLAELAPGLAVFVTQLGGALVAALQVAGPLLAQLAGFLSANATWLGPVVIALGTLSAVAGPLITGLTGLATAVRVVTMVFNGMRIALLSNPFTAIAAAVIALAVVIITNWTSIRDTTVGIFNAVWGFIKGVWDTITGWISDRVRDIIAAIGWLADLPGKVADWFGGILSAAVGKLGELVSWVASLPGKILGALGDLGSLLLDAGKNMILGLLNGLKNAAGAVIDFFKNLISDAVDSVLSFLGISSPSKVMHRIGEYTAQGFAHGIRDATPLAARAANRLANTATFDPVRADFGATATGSRPAVTVQQTINATPEQTPWAIATAANRQLGYALRTGGGV
jgi:phage-related protein